MQYYEGIFFLRSRSPLISLGLIVTDSLIFSWYRLHEWQRNTVCKVSSLCLRCTITVRYICFYIFIYLLVFIFLYFLFSPSLYWISEEDTLYKCTREVKLRQRRQEQTPGQRLYNFQQQQQKLVEKYNFVPFKRS